MRTARHTLRPLLAANIRTLMDRRQWSGTQLAAKAGVSQRQISYILREELDTSTAILEGIAHAFGIPIWMLFMEGLPADVLDSPELPQLVERYSAFAQQRVSSEEPTG